MHGTRTGEILEGMTSSLQGLGDSSFRPWAQGHGRVALTNLFSAVIISVRLACPSKNCRIRFYGGLRVKKQLPCKFTFNDPAYKNSRWNSSYFFLIWETLRGCWTHKKNDNTKETSKIRRKEREMIMTVEIRNVCTTSFFQVKTSWKIRLTWNIH